MVTDLKVGSTTEHIDYSDSALDGTTDTDVPQNRAFGELRHQIITFSSSPIGELTYDASGERRDDLGRVHFKTEIFGGITHTYEYEYDERNRLETVYLDSVQNETFGYDANGNRTSYTGPSGPVAPTYDNQDRLLTYGTTTFTYGPNGEIRTKTVAGQVTSYTYDALGNLITVTPPSLARPHHYLHGRRPRSPHRQEGRQHDQKALDLRRRPQPAVVAEVQVGGPQVESVGPWTLEHDEQD